MSIGNLKTNGDKGNNFTWQYAVLQLLKEISDNISPPIMKTPINLGAGPAYIWPFVSGYNAYMTLTANSTLSIIGAVAGDYGTLKITQGGLGSYTLTLPVGSRVGNTGAGILTLSTAVGAQDIATFYYDGTNFYWTITTDFT